MKQAFLFMILFPVAVWCQQVRTIVPTQPVLMGTAFQIQYIIANGPGFVSASTPVFDSCHVVSGPNYYKGISQINGSSQLIQNIAYTLVADKAGLISIPSIQARFSSGVTVEGSITYITVHPPPNASYTTQSSYTDRGLYTTKASSLDDLVRKNLFLKLEVNKKSVYSGEPVIAKFTLYSRLQSSSEAERSPSFYGFSVVDMLDVNQAHTAVEVVNGQVYNTAVLRKVQLFPVQAGTLTIDPMLVSNEIEFVDSSSRRKQTIVHELSTEPVTITVKPLPDPRPDKFSGMVGRFIIAAKLEKAVVAVNEGGLLKVTVSGAGNYIQMAEPVVRWPKGLEPLETVVNSNLNEATAPVSGSRTYSFPFVADSIGSYTIEPVIIAFFDPATHSYKEARSDSLKLTVNAATKRKSITVLPARKSAGWIAAIFLVIAVVIVLALTLYKKTSKKLSPLPASRPGLLQLEEALWQSADSPKRYCSGVLNMLQQVKAPALSAGQADTLRVLRDHCQEVVYTNKEDLGREEFRDTVRSFLKALHHSAYL